MSAWAWLAALSVLIAGVNVGLDLAWVARTGKMSIWAFARDAALVVASALCLHAVVAQ